uniref:Uncharacterized protein n=1 Tax=Glossina pallidipes TaxID=7398 RepID=A0A1A9ZM73_GLOPL
MRSSLLVLWGSKELGGINWSYVIISSFALARAEISWARRIRAILAFCEVRQFVGRSAALQDPSSLPSFVPALKPLRKILVDVIDNFMAPYSFWNRLSGFDWICPDPLWVAMRQLTANAFVYDLVAQTARLVTKELEFLGCSFELGAYNVVIETYALTLRTPFWTDTAADYWSLDTCLDMELSDILLNSNTQSMLSQFGLFLYLFVVFFFPSFLWRPVRKLWPDTSNN